LFIQISYTIGANKEKTIQTPVHIVMNVVIQKKSKKRKMKLTEGMKLTSEDEMKTANRLNDEVNNRR